LIDFTSTPALFDILSVTCELVWGTFTAPLKVAPAVASVPVELLAST
jgi:hypothetical protein